MCVCVCVLCRICMHSCTYMCLQARVGWHSLPYSLQMGSFMEPGARLGASKPQQYLCLQPSHFRVMVLHIAKPNFSRGVGDSDSGPCACTALPSEPSFQPQIIYCSYFQNSFVPITVTNIGDITANKGTKCGCGAEQTHKLEDQTPLVI